MLYICYAVLIFLISFSLGRKMRLARCWFWMHAGTALFLLKGYGELADQKEENDLTALQLLAKMPSAFKSQTQMRAFENFIYPRKSLITLSLSNKHARIYIQKHNTSFLFSSLCQNHTSFMKFELAN